MGTGVIEVAATDELTAAISVLSQLENEARSLPDKLAQAVELTNANDITSIRQREATISVELWTARARVLKLQIAAKQAERAEILPAIEHLDAKIEEETEVYQSIQDAEYEQRVKVQELSARAGILESKRQTLFEEIADLKKELGQLVDQRAVNGGK